MLLLVLIDTHALAHRCRNEAFSRQRRRQWQQRQAGWYLTPGGQPLLIHSGFHCCVYVPSVLLWPSRIYLCAYVA